MSLLSSPLTVHTLKALETEAMELMQLTAAVGSPPQSTIRVNMRALAEFGVIEKQRRMVTHPAVEYRLTPAGEALLEVGGVLQDWLRLSPGEPMALGSVAAKSTVRALVEGWSTNIMRALAAKPYALTELSRLIPGTSYHSLERRLGAMRLTNLIDADRRNGRGTPYRTTTWLRQSIVPLVFAAAWEQGHLPWHASPIDRLDVETAFLLGVPLMELSSCASGRCRLQVELRNGGDPLAAGVLVGVDQGRLVSCSSRLAGEVDAIVSGELHTWFNAVGGDCGNGFEVGGDVELAQKVTSALRGAAHLKVNTLRFG